MKKKRLLIALAVVLGAGVCVVPWWETLWNVAMYRTLSYEDMMQHAYTIEFLGKAMYSEKHLLGTYEERREQIERLAYSSRPLKMARFGTNPRFAVTPAVCYTCEQGVHDCCLGSQVFYKKGERGAKILAYSYCQCTGCDGQRGEL